MAQQAYDVSLGVADEGHVLRGPSGAEPVVVVGEDQLGLGDNLNPVGPERGDRRLDVVDPKVDQGTRRRLLQQQPDGPGPEEQQSGWVEETRRLGPEQPAIEVPSPIEVVCVLGDLVQIRHAISISAADQSSG